MAWLLVEKAVPIREDHIWNSPSFTHGQSEASSTWTGKVRRSLVKLDGADGAFLETLLGSQVDSGATYP